MFDFILSLVIRFHFDVFLIGCRVGTYALTDLMTYLIGYMIYLVIWEVLDSQKLPGSGVSKLAPFRVSPIAYNRAPLTAPCYFWWLPLTTLGFPTAVGRQALAGGDRQLSDGRAAERAGEPAAAADAANF